MSTHAPPSPLHFLFALLLASGCMMVSDVKGDERLGPCNQYFGPCTSLTDCEVLCTKNHGRYIDHPFAYCDARSCFCRYHCGGSISQTCIKAIDVMPGSAAERCQNKCKSEYKNGKGVCLPFSMGCICQCSYDC